MKTKKQRYCLAFHGRVDEAVGADQRHARFFAGIADMPPPWGLGNRPVPPAPDFGRGSSAAVGLTKFLGDGVKRAMLTYRYRRMLSDDGYSDDRLLIDLDPAKVDVHHLTYTVIPRYVEAFDAYRVDYYDEQFADAAYAARGAGGPDALAAKPQEYVNPRSTVEQVWPVSFYDELLCRRAFGLTPAELAGRFEGQIEHARLMHNGVYLVGTSKVVPFSEAQTLCRKMTVLAAAPAASSA